MIDIRRPHRPHLPKRRSIWLSGLMCTLLAVPFVIAQAADVDPSRRVTLIDVNGRETTGTLRQLQGGKLVLNEQPDQPVALADLFAIRWTGNSDIRRELDPTVDLANGDQLRARPETMDEESLTVRWVRYPAWPPLKLPLESVRGVLVDPPASDPLRSRTLQRIRAHQDPHDLVLLENSDTVTGELQSLTDQNLALTTSVGDISIDRSRVRALAFNPELISVLPMQGLGAVIRLIDGSRLHVRDLRLVSENTLAFVLQAGPEQQIPLSAVESLQVLGGRVTYLSDLEPAEYKFEPFLNLTWPLRRDTNVTGGPLRLRGTECVKGLGMHSRSTATYALSGQYRQFQATIGIDDDTAGQGSALFQVLVDGRPVFSSDVLTGTSDPVHVGPIAIENAKSLTLRVDYGTLGDILDHANWCDARLVK